MTSPLQELTALGVSVWLDDISRDRLKTGNLAALIRDDEVRGVTSNPTIFAGALAKGTSYNDQIADLAVTKVGVEEASRDITTYDIRWAADVLRSIYDASDGVDGRVSLEVDPRLARETAATVAQARSLWWMVDRPNMYIKIPATVEGLPAITAALADGISVNVTLIFSLERYEAVIDAFMTGLEQAAANGHDITRIGSVASFFVSRVDTEVDKRLDKLGTPEAAALRGTAALANARLAYELYERKIAEPRWAALVAKGAKVQRPLWASTSTKDPAFPDTMYVTELVAPDTVNTMPEATIHATADHAKLHGDTIRGTYEESRKVWADLENLGIGYDDVVQVLEDEGVAKFATSWNELLETIRTEMSASTAKLPDITKEPFAMTEPLPPQEQAEAPGDGATGAVGEPTPVPVPETGPAPANPGVIADTELQTEETNPLRDVRDRRIPRVAGPSVLVMFGVTGDLARKKLLPAIYDLANRGLLPPGFSLVGFARRDWEHEDFAQITYEAVKEHARTPFRDTVWQQVSEGVRFVPGEFNDDAAFDRLAATVKELDRERGTGGNVAFYLSIPPGSFPTVVEQLKRSGLADPGPADAAGRRSWRRVVIEKPFGRDLATAQELNHIVDRVFPAESVFRIDHYLGKETVQNILALRFANTLYEPIWNRGYVDHVQITMAEDIGIGGRAGYYDGIGAARDVIQNHLLQLLALTAMEEPVSFAADSLRTEKEKVLSAVRLPADPATGTARGQYAAGWQGGVQVRGYLEEDGIPADSRTETYAAVRLTVDTRRWAGVPFYLRTGKRLPRRMTEIAVMFQRAPHLPFAATDTKELGQNALVIRVQPDEGITVRFGSKVPGSSMEVRDVNMDFAYGGSFTEASPEAYERLLLDVLIGDPPLFPRQEEVELSWRILDPIEDFWAEYTKPEQYVSGTSGPASSDAMMARDGRAWRRL